MSDSLFDEIEQFLANGGEPPEPTPEEQVLAAFEATREAVQPIIEAIQAVCESIVKIVKEFCAYATEWYGQLVIGLRREQLRAKLEAWRLPKPVVTWLVARCPLRWLPQYEMPPPLQAI